MKLTVAFTAPQMDYLKAEAERLGLSSVAELVRRIVDQHREGRRK